MVPGSISRIYPNRFSPDPLVRSGRLQLPDSTGGFTLVADRPNRTEEVRWDDRHERRRRKAPRRPPGEGFAPLAVASLDEVTTMFRSLGQQVVEARLLARVRP